MLAPQAFLPDTGANSGTYAKIYLRTGNPWMTGQGFRFVPGAHRPGPSADALGSACDAHPDSAGTCYATAHVVHGSYFQPTANFWTLQWRESAIYVFASLLLLATGLVAVRRWRA